MLLSLLATALAGEQTLRYALTVGGQVVGERVVTVHYVSRPTGERRVIEATLKATVAGRAIEARTTGQSNPSGATFSTAVAIDGRVESVQGVEQRDGSWRLTVADGRAVTVSTVRDPGVVLTSLDVVDPGRAVRLDEAGGCTLLFAETGDVLTGTLGAGQATRVGVAGVEVASTRYTVDTPLGRARFDLDANGLLLRSEASWLGASVVATLLEVPSAATFGTVETTEQLGAEVKAEGL